MKKELKHMIIEYTNKDNDYIEYIMNRLDDISDEIVTFFNLGNFDPKVSVKIHDNIIDFENRYKECFKTKSVLEWAVGFAKKEEIDVLCLEELKKRKGHAHGDENSILYLILHEFTHSVHLRYHFYKNNKIKYYWLNEGIATCISHQYDNYDLEFDATLEEVTVSGGCRYVNYYTMFKYVLNNYGKDYILKLIKDEFFLENETPRLYYEVFEYINNHKKCL